MGLEMTKYSQRVTIPKVKEFMQGVEERLEPYVGVNGIGVLFGIKASDIEHIEGTVIISHMCKPYTDNLITTIKRKPNFFTDMSGVVNSKYNCDQILACIENIKRFLGGMRSKTIIIWH